MDVRYPSHIYQLTLEPLNITLGERTAESAGPSRTTAAAVSSQEDSKAKMFMQ